MNDICDYFGWDWMWLRNDLRRSKQRIIQIQIQTQIDLSDDDPLLDMKSRIKILIFFLYIMLISYYTELSWKGKVQLLNCEDQQEMGNLQMACSLLFQSLSTHPWASSDKDCTTYC